MIFNFNLKVMHHLEYRKKDYATLADSKPNGYDLLSCKSVDSRGISLPVDQPGGTKSDSEGTYQVGNAVTSDLAVRQAINYGIDREQLVKNVMNGITVT